MKISKESPATTEIWRSVKNYEGLYEASNQGRVRPVKPRFKPGGRYSADGCLKQGNANRFGHKFVVLTKDKEHKPTLVSHIVWEAFYGVIPEGCEINHRNELPSDNNLDNLEAVSHRRNMYHGTGIARSAHGHKKACQARDGFGNVVGQYSSQKQAAALIGVNASCISSALRGRTKTAGGLEWEHIDQFESKPLAIYEMSKD